MRDEIIGEPEFGSVKGFNFVNDNPLHFPIYYRESTFKTNNIFSWMFTNNISIQ